MIADKVADKIVQDKKKVFKPAGFRASEAGVLCARYHYHARIDWELRPAPDPRLAHIFALGEALEDYVSRKLNEAGVRVERAQVAAADKDLDLTGHVDGFVRINGADIPVESKSVNQFDWEAIESWRDMVSPSKPFLMRWALQLPLYLYLHNCERGLYLLLNKATGELKEIEVTISEAWEYLERAEGVLREAKAAVNAGQPPDPEPATPSLCAKCWAKDVGLCPGKETPIPAVVDLDAAQEAAAVIAATRDAHKQYEQAQKALAQALAAINVSPGERMEFFAGTIPVRISAYETTRYEIPDEIKKNFAIKVPARKVEVLA